MQLIKILIKHTSNHNHTLTYHTQTHTHTHIDIQIHTRGYCILSMSTRTIKFYHKHALRQPNQIPLTSTNEKDVFPVILKHIWIYHICLVWIYSFNLYDHFQFNVCEKTTLLKIISRQIPLKNRVYVWEDTFSFSSWKQH